MDIVIGVGGGNQPGDKGGVYALHALDGSIKWYHESKQTISPAGPDGVYSSPLIVDIDKDGKKEVIYGGWDQYVWVLDGATGTPKSGWPRPVLDTVWSSPTTADLDGDGWQEIPIGADITENANAGTKTGGIFHVFNRNGDQITPGFDGIIGNSAYGIKGKWEEEVLWSSPVTADFDKDGRPEIAYGTGNFSGDSRGSYIRVWNHDGTPKFVLPTQGKTFATPVFADLYGDGNLELIATTLDGYVHAWNKDG